jgi:predicted SAM-dependent methyltransferase
MPNICVGAGSRQIDGFLNFDLFTSDKVQYGRVDSLPSIKDHSVDILFSNAVLEHIDPKEYFSTFNEWRRILNKNGKIICLGIPFFDRIVECYFNGDLKLQDVHNYTTGSILYCESAEMLMGQIHKALFNKDSLKHIFNMSGFNSCVFHYCYPGENLPVNLGVIGFLDSVPDIISVLKLIPTIKDYIDLDTIII